MSETTTPTGTDSQKLSVLFSDISKEFIERAYKPGDENAQHMEQILAASPFRIKPEMENELVRQFNSYDKKKSISEAQDIREDVDRKAILWAQLIQIEEAKLDRKHAATKPGQKIPSKEEIAAATFDMAFPQQSDPTTADSGKFDTLKSKWALDFLSKYWKGDTRTISAFLTEKVKNSLGMNSAKSRSFKDGYSHDPFMADERKWSL